MIRIEALTEDMTATSLSSVNIYTDAETAALLPKSVRLTRGHAHIQFRTNGVNGGINETGVKRVKALLKAADKLGIGVVFAQPAYIKDELNAPYWEFGMRNITRAELETLLG